MSYQGVQTCARRRVEINRQGVQRVRRGVHDPWGDQKRILWRFNVEGSESPVYHPEYRQLLNSKKYLKNICNDRKRHNDALDVCKLRFQSTLPLSRLQTAESGAIYPFSKVEFHATMAYWLGLRTSNLKSWGLIPVEGKTFRFVAQFLSESRQFALVDLVTVQFHQPPWCTG